MVVHIPTISYVITLASPMTNQLFYKILMMKDQETSNGTIAVISQRLQQMAEMLYATENGVLQYANKVGFISTPVRPSSDNGPGVLDRDLGSGQIILVANFQKIGKTKFNNYFRIQVGRKMESKMHGRQYLEFR